MPRTAAFDQNVSRYEDWFKRNQGAFLSELRALKAQLPQDGRSLEVGVGTGRFALPLGISIGLDPSLNMAKLAKQRGVDVVLAVAERLPFKESSFHKLLMVTTVCFLDDVVKAFSEARRVLAPGGVMLLGIIDSDSPLGKLYQEKKEKSQFYREARFWGVGELQEALEAAGFSNIDISQTIFRPPDAITEPEPVIEGHGEGLFVVLRAEK